MVSVGHQEPLVDQRVQDRSDGRGADRGHRHLDRTVDTGRHRRHVGAGQPDRSTAAPVGQHHRVAVQRRGLQRPHPPPHRTGVGVLVREQPAVCGRVSDVDRHDQPLHPTVRAVQLDDEHRRWTQPASGVVSRHGQLLGVHGATCHARVEEPDRRDPHRSGDHVSHRTVTVRGNALEPSGVDPDHPS